MASPIEPTPVFEGEDAKNLIEMFKSAPSPEEKERRAIGIKDNLVRFAIGIEDAEDLIADLEQALTLL